MIKKEENYVEITQKINKIKELIELDDENSKNFKLTKEKYILNNYNNFETQIISKKLEIDENIIKLNKLLIKRLSVLNITISFISSTLFFSAATRPIKINKLEN